MAVTNFTRLGIAYPKTDDQVALSSDLKQLAVTADNAIGTSVNDVSSAISAAQFNRGSVAATTDLNTLIQLGAYDVPVSSDPNLNRPTNYGFGMLVLPWGKGVKQLVFAQNGEYFVRNGSATTFYPWYTPPKPELPPLPDTLFSAGNVLVEDWTRRRGGIKTTDRPLVSIRFDHGLANLDSLVRPIMERHGFPYSIALNSGDWGRAENTGITPIIVDGWVQGGLAEIWNHGRHHVGSTDETEIYDLVVGGLEELRSQLPSADIDGFVPAGTEPGLGDFYFGKDVPAFTNTYAGNLIRNSHAVSSGYLAGSFLRPLDGIVRQGMGHRTIDKSELPDFQAYVNEAISKNMGLQLMLHPSLLDKSGYITTSAFAEMMDWLALQRESGLVDVVSPYDALITRFEKP